MILGAVDFSSPRYHRESDRALSELTQVPGPDRQKKSELPKNRFPCIWLSRVLLKNPAPSFPTSPRTMEVYRKYHQNVRIRMPKEYEA